MQNKINQYGDIILQDMEFDTEDILSFDIASNNKLITAIENQRKAKGYTDTMSNNKLIYNFYLTYNFSKKTLKLYANCQNGKYDKNIEYILPLTEVEEKDLLFKTIESLADEKLASQWC